MPMEEEEQNDSDDAEYKAYFTNIPPPEPQRLVLVGDVSDNIQISEKMQQLLGNMSAIEYDGLEFEPQRSSPTRSISGNNKILDDKATRTKKRHTRKVQKLLHQLISNLPILDPPSSPELVMVNDTYYQSRRAFQSPLCVSKAASPKEKRSCCSIAVQAWYNAPDTKCDIERKDDWMGGVRALRDSHVRLVQRQLRHIERLNRALDRVTHTNPTWTDKFVPSEIS